MRATVFTLLACILAVTASAAEAPAWEDLCAGDSLEGWRVEGGEWAIKDGVITGKLIKTEDQMDQKVNAWLIYEKKNYADFELEYEFRTPVPTNGGLQFRSHWLPLLPIPEGVPAAEAPKDVYGYQANIETRTRLGSGRLICENGRGMLKDSNMEAAKTLSQKGWNKMRIVARGSHIEVWLHDKLANQCEDDAFLSGQILIQVRGDEKAAKETIVEYRNIRVKDYGREGQWKALFDGESLAGWKEWGSEKWSIKDGAILGSSGPKKSEGYLATEATWKDFRVRGAFKMLGEGNFGLFYHSSISLREDGYPIIAGVQGEVEPGYPSKSGWVYESYKRGWLQEPDPNTPGALALRPTEWNEIEIQSTTLEDGKTQRVKTWINGVHTLDLTDKTPNLVEGAFALQLHSGGVDGITWKDLYVLED